MPTTPLADAIPALEEALATIPAGLEARSDFFVQWRARTLDLLERTFRDDSTAVTKFKEIEFSPRRLTKNDEKDQQLKLDAYLAGCDAARSLLNQLIHGVLAPSAPAPAAAPEPPVQGAVQTPAVLIDATPLPVLDDVIKGGSMNGRDICAPVRGSLTRFLSAGGNGDQDLALLVSAQLLADLTVLSRDEKFKAVFEKVLSKTLENGTAEAVKAAAPMCVWSLLSAMNELSKN